jgi:uncharacterized membrane protein
LSESLALAVGSMLLSAFVDVIYKRALMSGSRPTNFLLTQSLVFNALNWAVALTSGSLSLEPALLFFGPLAGATSYASRFLFLRGLRRGDVSVHAPIFRLSFLVTAALAIGLSGESLYAGKLVGMGLAVLAVIALVDLRDGGAVGGRAGLVSLATATLLIGLYGWIQKLGSMAGLAPAAFLVAQGFIYISIALPSSLVTGSLRPGRVELTLAPISGVLNSIAYLMLLSSLRTGEASVNIPIVQLSFVLTAFLGALLLHERLSRRKVFGLLAAVLAVIVFNVRG